MTDVLIVTTGYDVTVWRSETASILGTPIRSGLSPVRTSAALGANTGASKTAASLHIGVEATS